VATDDLTAAHVVEALDARRSEGDLATVRKRLAPDEPAIGVRMGSLFEVAKAHTDLPLAEVDRLRDHPAHEPRLAALCILDFQARRSLDDDARRQRYDLYLRRHDRITTWDMVDRAAPRVVGRHLAGRSLAPLHDLATSPDPLRRRTAITAPLWFARYGPDDESAKSFAVAALLAGDPEPVVHNAVGIFLKHAGERDRAALHRFLGEHAASMPRPALRLATEKLSPADRGRYRG
jgi:3-methyladenine DNA glycosylase AlkD